MTITLSKELERFVHNAVRAGRYATEEDVIRDALLLLRKGLATDVDPPGRRRKPDDAEAIEPLTLEELNRRMIASGLIVQLPDPAEDVDDADDAPEVINGEPLSVTIIRERR